MEIKEIVEKLKYYTPELPKEAIKEALKHKEEITPKLLEMLEYTKENLEAICKEKDEFFGYSYAFFILAEFKEKKAFPYLIDILNKDVEVVEYIIGDDYPDYLPRLLASTYNGDDKALFNIIENENVDEFVRSSVLTVFSILYFHGVKSREFLVNYFKKLLEERKENDDAYLYEEIMQEICDLKLTELTEVVKNNINLVKNHNDRDEILKELQNGEEINKDVYPFCPLYEYIHDTIEIMEDWNCFSYIEDEEFENSDEYEMCQSIIRNRDNNSFKTKVEKNDLCSCESGKKYNDDCLNKDIHELNMIDEFICKAEWYVQKEEERKAYRPFRIAWFIVEEICKNNNIKSIDEYDKKYKGYEFLSNWLQDYDDILSNSNKANILYQRLEFWDNIENTFNLNDTTQLYWKEKAILERANTYFRLGNKQKATELIENYLKEKPEWVWGYVEMSCWYDNEFYKENYDIEKAKEILLRAEKINNMEDMDIIYERLEDIYMKLGDKKTAKIYSDKLK